MASESGQEALRTGAIRWIRATLGAGGAFLALLAAGLIGRAATRPSRQERAAPAPEPDLDGGLVAERLSGAIQIPSVSHEDPQKRDARPFDDLRTYLEQTYPRLHKALTREIVSGHTLVHTWPGSDHSLDPLVMLAHQDVVPVDPGTDERWEQPPFSGNIADGYVWGRGALDNKENLIGLLEAVERLHEQGFEPVRTIILVSGHDEELGGSEGAAAVARLLAERGTRPAFVLDEGGAIADGIVPGVPGSVAVIGVAEKGYVSVELTVDVEGGHSSTPPIEGAIGIVTEAIGRLERDRFPARLVSPVRSMFETLAPEASFGYRLLFANLWLFEPLIIRVLERMPETAALVRTTTAPTVFQAGAKDNVVPGHARAVVNFRPLPGDSIDGVLRHVHRTVADDRVRAIALSKQREASHVSPTDTEEYRLLSRTIRETFPGTVVVPYLETGGTDSREFQDLTDRIYRFMPLRLSREDLQGIHGTNERVSVAALAKAVDFYMRLIRTAAG